LKTTKDVNPQKINKMARLLIVGLKRVRQGYSELKPPLRSVGHALDKADGKYSLILVPEDPLGQLPVKLASNNRSQDGCQQFPALFQRIKSNIIYQVMLQYCYHPNSTPSVNL